VVLSRVLLLTALSPELAAARGVPVRAVGVAYLVVLAVAVSLSAVAIGAVLSTALLIGPAATALRVTKSPGRAMAAAALAGTAATWLGVLLAYDSYYWTSGERATSGGHSWPVSFFIVALIVAGYLLTYLRSSRRGRNRSARPVPAPEEQEAPACSPA
jgi:zinc/manganese transport system permease protein